MHVHRTETLFDQLHRSLSRQRPTGDDGPLLAQFVATRQESAFAAIVARHGSMVLGVCRRTLGPGPDAEDAFQAVFLTLVRQADRITHQACLGSWLYRVAYLISLKARQARARQQPSRDANSEAIATDGAPSDIAEWRELKQVLDAEIAGLPDKYRAPVVLCDLEGWTYAEAAERLGCPKGTLAIRLARARERLRSRLTSRGITLSLAGWTALPVLSSAPLNAAVVATLQRSAAALAAGQSLHAAGISQTIQTLLQQGVVMKSFLVKAVVTGVVMSGLLGAALCWLPGQPAAVPTVQALPAPRETGLKPIGAPRSEPEGAVLELRLKLDKTHYSLNPRPNPQPVNGELAPLVEDKRSPQKSFAQFSFAPARMNITLEITNTSKQDATFTVTDLDNRVSFHLEGPGAKQESQSWFVNQGPNSIHKPITVVVPAGKTLSWLQLKELGVLKLSHGWVGSWDKPGKYFLTARLRAALNPAPSGTNNHKWLNDQSHNKSVTLKWLNDQSHNKFVTLISPTVPFVVEKE